MEGNIYFLLSVTNTNNPKRLYFFNPHTLNIEEKRVYSRSSYNTNSNRNNTVYFDSEKVELYMNDNNPNSVRPSRNYGQFEQFHPINNGFIQFISMNKQYSLRLGDKYSIPY